MALRIAFSAMSKKLIVLNYFYSDQSSTPPGGSALLPKVTVSKPGRQIDIVSKDLRWKSS